MTDSSLPKNTGLKRIIMAGVYSLQGMRDSFRTEAAFRQEVALATLLIPVALLLDVSLLEKALLISSVLLVLIVELINTAIEAVVDRISLEKHPLSGKAKDAGSAAVLLALIACGLLWLAILFG